MLLLDESRAGAGFEANLAESGFVLAYILLQHVQQRLGLLRADVDPLEVLDLHVFLRGLADMAEHQKEVPEIHPDLHAVGIAFAVVGRFLKYDPGLGRCHRTTWYRTRRGFQRGFNGILGLGFHKDRQLRTPAEDSK